MLKFLGKEVTIGVSEKNPVAIRRTSKEHLLSYQYQRQALEFRERCLVKNLALELVSKLLYYESIVRCDVYSCEGSVR